MWPSIAPNPTMPKTTTQESQILDDNEEFGLCSSFSVFTSQLCRLASHVTLDKSLIFPEPHNTLTKQILSSHFTHGEIETQRDKIVYSISVWVPGGKQWPNETEKA